MELVETLSLLSDEKAWLNELTTLLCKMQKVYWSSCMRCFSNICNLYIFYKVRFMKILLWRILSNAPSPSIGLSPCMSSNAWIRWWNCGETHNMSIIKQTFPLLLMMMLIPLQCKNIILGGSVKWEIGECTLCRQV